MTKEKKIEVYLKVLELNTAMLSTVAQMKGADDEAYEWYMGQMDDSPQQICEQIFGFTFPLEDDPFDDSDAIRVLNIKVDAVTEADRYERDQENGKARISLTHEEMRAVVEAMNSESSEDSPTS